MTQTLGQINTSIDYQDYVILLGNATTDIQVLILTLLRQAGALGNTLFFVCSAWFCVEKKGHSRKKALLLLITVWVISIIIFLIYITIEPSCLTIKDIIKQIFPTCFANNWYITCYIIFLFVYPWVNKLISILDQRQLLRIVLFSSVLWIGVDYFYGAFFPSPLILWVTIYFLIAYLKLYCGSLISSTIFGICLLMIGIVGYISQVVLTNILGLHVDFLSHQVLHWNNNCQTADYTR